MNVGELIVQSVAQVDEPQSFGSCNGVFKFAVPDEFNAKEKQELGSYFLRICRPKGANVLGCDSAETYEIETMLNTALVSSSSLTPPKRIYHKHIAQPLLTCFIDDELVFDIVKEQVGRPLKHDDLSEIFTSGKVIEVFTPLITDYLNLAKSSAQNDIDISNIFCERTDEGIKLHFIDQIADDIKLEHVDIRTDIIKAQIVGDLIGLFEPVISEDDIEKLTEQLMNACSREEKSLTQNQ